MTVRRTILTSLSATALAAPLAITFAPTVHAANATVQLSSFVQVAVYDPKNDLGLAGDTHELRIILVQGRDGGAMSIDSYQCGPHDLARTPRELGCATAGRSDILDVTGASARLVGNAIRWRAYTTLGSLDVKLQGGVRQEWVEHEWRHAEGTNIESGRQVVRRHRGAAALGSVAGLALAQPAEWRERAEFFRRRTVERHGKGPAVPIPSVPAPGTARDGWESVGQATVTWQTSLGANAFEVGMLVASDGGPDSWEFTRAEGHLSRQQCEPGQEPVPPNHARSNWCTVTDLIGNEVLPPYTFAFDPASATARMNGTITSNVYPPAESGAHTAAATWRGSRPVGIEKVDIHRSEPDAKMVETISGVRWQGAAANATVDGKSVPVTTATMFAFKRRLQVTNP